MPQFHRVNWEDYIIDIGPGDNWHKLSRLSPLWMLFNKDSIPYLNQLPLIFDCKIIPPESLKIPERLTYEWRIRDIEGSNIHSLKTKTLDIVPNDGAKDKLVSEIIDHTIKYVGEIRLGRNKAELEKEQWRRFISLTVLDRDIYSMEKIMTRLADVIWFLFGVLATIGIQKLLGVI